MQAPSDLSDVPQRPYVTGFALALVLTGIPFGLVVADLLPRFATLVVIALLALVQVMVHLRFFLHIDLPSTPRENRRRARTSWRWPSPPC
jgi:heme/copper-type cytochrome/quinol oxidase subunit 4